MSLVFIGLAFIGFLAFLAFLPALLSAVLDSMNRRRIVRYCVQRGMENVEVKAWPNHYGVSFSKAGQRHYAKCRVVLTRIEWKGTPPEDM
jgi:hypothetical protein